MNWPFYLRDKDIHLSLVPTFFVLVSLLSDINKATATYLWSMHGIYVFIHLL